FRQKEGINYFDTYAPVARITTIRLLLALVVIHNLVVHQMDVKTAFLNGDLEEEVYMKQPKGFVMPGNEHKDIVQNSDESQRDDHSDDVPSEIPEPRKVLRMILEPIMKLCNLEILLSGKKQTWITSSTMKSEFIALSVGVAISDPTRNPT
ncbi:zinc finger, CCHC-type containing protein, partial [Tanacetum coccineum]